MPTLGGHFSDDLEALVKCAARAAPEGKVGPYIVEAVRQRLEREGLLTQKPVSVAELHAALDRIIAERGADAARALVLGDVASEMEVARES
jgi:hypothetical protein